MRYATTLVCAVACVLAAPCLVTAQGTNPFDGDSGAIRAGRQLFGARCAACHGADAKGISGPDLTALWSFGTSDERVFRTVRQGVAGSIMPASDAPDDEVWAMVAYVKSISTVTPDPNLPGNAAHGREIVRSQCVVCHQVHGEGGRLGPDLSLIGQTRSGAALRESIRNPSEAVAARYRTIELVTATGERVRGARKGEDAFSLQVLDTNQRLQGYAKRDLERWARTDESLMPVFSPRELSDDYLDDVIKFLGTLRGQ